MTAKLLLGAVLLALTSCATGGPRDVIAFDRAQFAFMLGDVKTLIDHKCRRATADKVECARLNEQWESVKRQVMTPPPASAPGTQIDVEQIMKLFGVLIGAAT